MLSPAMLSLIFFRATQMPGDLIWLVLKKKKKKKISKVPNCIARILWVLIFKNSYPTRLKQKQHLLTHINEKSRECVLLQIWLTEIVK